MMGGATGRCWIDALEAMFAQVKLINEDIDHSDRISVRNIVLEARWQQDALRVRIPRHFDHGFHGKSITDSAAFRSPIPRQSDQ